MDSELTRPDSMALLLEAETVPCPGSMALLLESEIAPANNCHRLVILGSPRTGKTSIISRFLKNKFDEKYTPTIENFHRKVYHIRGEAYRLDILDTSGNHPFPAMRRLSIITGDLFILVCTIDNRESFEEVKRLLVQILQAKGQPLSSGMRRKTKNLVPIVIVGNKCDKDNDRVVATDQMKDLTDLYPTCSYVETSVKKDINIEEIFLKLFGLAKLPTEMTPSLHRNSNYVDSTSSQSSRRGRSLRSHSVRRSLRRSFSDAYGAVVPNAQRPTIRTDMLIMQTKQNMLDTESKARKTRTLKCVIQ